MKDTRFLSFIRHPLTVLVVGAVVTSILVPILSDRVNREKLLRERRLNIAMEIIKDNVETNRRLNSMVTALELFQKDNSGPSARVVDYRAEQKELRGKIDQAYLEFDSQAWWWYSEIYSEAVVVNIISSRDLNELSRIRHEYGENLGESTRTLDGLWNPFLRDTYKPNAPRNTQLMETTRNKLQDLNNKRSQLVMDAVKIFTPN